MTCKRKVKIEALKEKARAYQYLSERDKIGVMKSLIQFIDQLNMRVDNLEILVVSKE